MHHFVLHFATHFVDDLIYGCPKHSQHGSWDCGVDRPTTTHCDRDSFAQIVNRWLSITLLRLQNRTACLAMQLFVRRRKGVGCSGR